MEGGSRLGPSWLRTRRAGDEEIAGALDVPLRLFEGETLAPPGYIRTRTGRPYSVFTAFKRAFQ